MKDQSKHIDKSVNYEDFVNIERELKKRAKKVFPFIPKFLIRFIEKKVHQDRLNYALHIYKGHDGIDFLDVILNDEFSVNIVVKNPENIPATGRYIIASNHPLGGMDGMALMYAIGQKRKDIKFLVNDLLLNLVNLKSLFIPINKHGRNPSDVVRIIDELYRSEQLVLVFPAGLVSRRQKGGIKDLEWKKSFVSKAIQHKRDIIPVHIDGQNSNSFYNWARYREMLGIKLNIEMFLLPNEMFSQKDKTITITFGKPISYSTFTKEFTHTEWAQKMKQHVYSMAEGNEEFKVN